MQTAKRATTGQEDTTSDYYVHPAFTNNVDLGGWRNELTGIWIGKYESARLDATSQTEGTDTKIKVQPGVQSLRNVAIGKIYTYAREYSVSLNSHMLKNSEWGAVAYLTHSQYGRNGHEVEVNDNSDYITADEGIETSKTQSSTGNVYGIYDLSGGAAEYLAIYYNGSTSSNLTNFGKTFASQGGESSEYATAYMGETISTEYKIGDATYETSGWNGDYAVFVNTDNPFLIRGGGYYDGLGAGIFNLYNSIGNLNGRISFRMCLAI